MNYGVIQVTLHRGLTDDQRCSIVRTAVENQLLTKNRGHFNQILNHCLEMSKLDAPVKIDWKILDRYAYSFILSYYE